MNLSGVEIPFTEAIIRDDSEAKLTQSPFIFYDGPPFATGLPHYGHLLAGTIKDVICRYKKQCGYKVPRQFGWDCHGLPIECEVEKHLAEQGKTPSAIDIKEYNDICRSLVMKCENDWETTVHRMGRWIDFRNNYKTMDFDFMNTIWKSFETMYNKGLVYQGSKVMPFSTGTKTPLSNFEAGQNYKDVVDTDAYVCFPLVSENEENDAKQQPPPTFLVAWTTTPWTLVANMALCVRGDGLYQSCKCKDGRILIMSRQAAERFQSKFGWTMEDDPFQGQTMVGKRYTPLFPTFGADYTGTVIADPFVTIEENSMTGTGIVHCAPGFGEDDYRVCVANGILQAETVNDFCCPIDENGCFTSAVLPELLQGKYVKSKEVETLVLDAVKAMGNLLQRGTIRHSYPYCYRTDTPLIYRLMKSWFIDVESLKGRLLHNQSQMKWYPDNIRENRFGQWLENARDWAVSRNRRWGTPIPIWMSEDGTEITVIGSAAELTERGRRISAGSSATDTLRDLHREHVDDWVIPSQFPDRPPLRRIPDVFDCWFESGCVPIFKSRDSPTFRPADFVAEGIDQTRGWFYTTLVISTAIHDMPPFRHVICNGHVLASDGKKMSKRLKNYADPTEVMDKYGADALRLYLLESPAAKGESMRFMEKGVDATARTILIPLHHAVRMLEQSANTESGDTTPPLRFMDNWILMYVQELQQRVFGSLDSYDVSRPIGEIRTFMERLNNTYIRLNRDRIKGGYMDVAANVLRQVLQDLRSVIAPFAPFHAAWLSQKLDGIKGQEICYKVTDSSSSISIKSSLDTMEVCMCAIEMMRAIRTNIKRSQRMPVATATLVFPCAGQVSKDDMEDVLRDEMHVKELRICEGVRDYVSNTMQLNFAKVGATLGVHGKRIESELVGKNVDDLPVIIGQYTITPDDVNVRYVLCEDKFGDNEKGQVSTVMTRQYGEMPIVLLVDTSLTDELRDDGMCKEVIRVINDARKEAGLVPSDYATMTVKGVAVSLNVQQKVRDARRTGNGDIIFTSDKTNESTIHCEVNIPTSV